MIGISPPSMQSTYDKHSSGLGSRQVGTSSEHEQLRVSSSDEFMSRSNPRLMAKAETMLKTTATVRRT